MLIQIMLLFQAIFINLCGAVHKDSFLRGFGMGGTVFRTIIRSLLPYDPPFLFKILITLQGLLSGARKFADLTFIYSRFSSIFPLHNNYLGFLMDLQKIEQGVHLILEGIGEDPGREGLRSTPQRVAQMYSELLSGLHEELDVQFATYEVENHDEMILIRDIPFYSFCEHHLLPFWGSVSLAYIPTDDRIVGFSTLIRVVEHFAKRLQVQERMTTQICDYLNNTLKTAGVLVIIRAHHLCISMRGVKKEQSETVTSAMRGYLRKQVTRLEALQLLRRTLNMSPLQQLYEFLSGTIPGGGWSV